MYRLRRSNIGIWLTSRFWIAIVLGLVLGVTYIALDGCATAAKPIHVGAINQTDSAIYDTLLIVQSTIDAAKQQPLVVGNQVTATALNKAIASYNVARTAYLAYHAGSTTDTTVLQLTVTQAVTDVAGIQKATNVTALEAK